MQARLPILHSKQKLFMNKPQGKNSKISERLKALDSHLGQRGQRGQSNKVSKSAVACEVSLEGSRRGRALARILGGELLRTSSGEYVEIRRTHERNYAHGNFTIGACCDRENYCRSHVEIDSPQEKIPRERLLFVDTETTGLYGAGVTPFLVGVGFFTSAGFETRQYLIPDLSDEAGMLEQVLKRFDAQSVLVSYNGKAFDLPLIRDRLIIHRLGREVPHRLHLDLLYPVRSLFKRRIGDCSLSNVEAQIFKFARVNDLPGAMAPTVYYDWLNNESSERLADVVEHNRQDIVSLAMLLAILAECHDSRGQSLDSPLDAYSMARRLLRRREFSQASDLLKARGAELDRLADAEIDFHRALAFKRTGDFASATILWERLRSVPGALGLKASEELAKWHEHQRRDYRQALQVTEEALSRGGLSRASLAPWDHRRKRLLRRLQAAKDTASG